MLLPGPGGDEVGRRLRTMPALRRGPLVALSGCAATRRRALEAGFDLFLLKPAEPDDIRAALGSHSEIVTEPGVQAVLAGYLEQIPAAIRSTIRRPDDSRRSVPCSTDSITEPTKGIAVTSAFAPGTATMNEVTLTRTVLLANPFGLHMRPSAAFVELAGRFNCNVTVTYNGQTVDGKSLWDLMLLAAMPGSELTLEVEGPDAPRALEALATFLSTPPPLDTSRSHPRGVFPEFAPVQHDGSVPRESTLARAEDSLTLLPPWPPGKFCLDPEEDTLSGSQSEPPASPPALGPSAEFGKCDEVSGLTEEELRPLAGESRSGLTKAEAEGLLDWLDNQGFQGHVLFSEGEPGFVVQW